ncbi:MAG: biotin--[acetyl-CoA-carboxylase] ligase [Lachnospiraceae bacterium]|nr:biotin--[acetyl-CoA-carboxylase] ligase [Lachnospiraceae bacterium]
MRIKENILLILEENKGNPISGEEIAEKIGCTRAGVWKAIKQLQNDGYSIDAVSNKGYTLKVSGDILSESFISKKIEEAGYNLKVICEEKTDSTNEYAKRLSSEFQNDDLLIVSAEQTAGKGRKGRSFYSPSDTGVYFSLLLHPNCSPEEATNLTTLAVTAEAVALEKITGYKTEIKWVNDIRIRNKKISGILTEGSTSFEDGKMNYVVIGIGVNLYEPEAGFPEDIKDIAGAVFEDSVQRENIRNLVVSEIVIRLLDYYNSFNKRTYLKDYESRCFVIGKNVTIISSSHEAINDEEVFVLGIDKDCHLHVRHSDGHESFLSSGEISVRI